MSIGLMLLLFVVFLLLGVPVAFTIGFTALLAIISQGFSFGLISQRLFVGLDSFPLMALPMFVLAGNLMAGGGITRRLWTFSRSALGNIPGGSGHVSVVSSMIFAAMSGSALATVGGLGKMQIDGMVEDGFHKEDAAAITAAASTIGPIIPPSIVFVLYGVLAGVSVGKLFIAGVVPGALMGASLMIYVAFLAFRHPEQYIRRPRVRGRALFMAFLDALPSFMTPVIIVGGILFGVFTPTEAASVAGLYAFILGLFYKEFTGKSLWKILVDTTKTSASIMLIIGFANAFSWMLTSMGAQQLFLDFITSISNSKYVILLLLNVALLIVGCFVETNSAVILLTPILVPTMKSLGVDPVHLGIILSVNLLIGILTPPMGMALYIVQGITHIPFEKIVRAVIIPILCLIVIQLLVTYIPWISLALPTLIG
jgi:tripartite ATP-independent transporter DctM subunit